MSFFDSIFRSNSIQAFARMLIREMKAAGDPRSSRFDAAHELIVFLEGDQQVGFANLKNLHKEFMQQVGTSRKVFLKHAVRSLLSTHKRPPFDFEDAKSDILPTVRARSYFTGMEMHARDSGKAEFVWPHNAIGEHLAVGIVYDLPESMIMIQQEQLDDWDVTFEEALALARVNLAELEGTFASLEDRLYIANANDNFDATRIIMTEWIRQLKIVGDPIVMVPDRDGLLITGSNDEKGLCMMARIARDSLEKPRRMNGFVYRLDSDKWEPWLPPSNYESFSELQRLQIESLSSEYAHQKTSLDEVYQDDSRVFVASFNVLANTNGLVSYSVWSEGVESLLPKTDEVAFASSRILESDDPPVKIPWRIVNQVVGTKMIEYPMYPRRFYIDEFPTDEELHEMQVLAQDDFQ